MWLKSLSVDVERCNPSCQNSLQRQIAGESQRTDTKWLIVRPTLRWHCVGAANQADLLSDCFTVLATFLDTRAWIEKSGFTSSLTLANLIEPIASARKKKGG